MLDDFLANHTTIGPSILVFLIVVVGWVEERVLGRTDIACVTWFFGVLVAAITPFTLISLGVFRWVLGMFLLGTGTAYLIGHYRRMTSRRGQKAKNNKLGSN
jgi:hypothetical protein